jgi:hypothetical protein
MRTFGPENGPVVIGGVGGSGTRVVAEIIAMFGFYLGRDLNNASDNLTYTLLLKRPEWFRKNSENRKQINTGLRILDKTLHSGENLSFRERFFIWKAARDMAKHGHNREGEGKGEWPHLRVPFIKDPRIPDFSDFHGWGWKEPNSHLLIHHCNDFFPDFRYIHTIRHGLDMAYSSNQQQLFNWASLFGIGLPDNKKDIPSASFRFWVEANRKAISKGEMLGEEKFLLVNFDDLCSNPLPGVVKIAGFLGISPDEELINKAAKLPVIPGTAGRYKEHPADIFDKADLDFLQDIGFQY